MADITYADKDKTQPLGTAPRTWRDEDANEVKNVVNNFRAPLVAGKIPESVLPDSALKIGDSKDFDGTGIADGYEIYWDLSAGKFKVRAPSGGISDVSLGGNTDIFTFGKNESSGAIELTIGLEDQTAKYVLAAPKGADGTPVFRRLDMDDIEGSEQLVDERYFDVVSDVLTLKYILPDIATLESFERDGSVLAYVSDSVRGGYFNYSASGTANGGTIFDAEDGGVWVRRYDGPINLQWFDVDPLGVSDSTDGVQAFFDVILYDDYTYNSRGKREGFVNKGFYRVTSTISVMRPLGTEIVGEGVDSTTFFLDAEEDSLFRISIYIGLKFSGFTVLTGNLTYSSGIPQVSTKAVDDRDNIAFSFNSSGGGTRCFFDNVEVRGFDVALDSTSNMLNGDNHFHTNCSFHNNNIVWNNTNDQALIWSFINCQMHFNEYCFYNPGGKLTVIGGDYINPGTFLYGRLDNMVDGFVAQSVKFENFQNIDPLTEPKWIDVLGDYQNIEFVNCSSRTGSNNLNSKTAFKIGQNSSVFFKNCYLDGDMEINVNSSIDRVTGHVTFDSCNRLPEISQTLSSAGAFEPYNIRLVNQKGSGNTRYNRNYLGFGNTLDNLNGISTNVAIDSFGWSQNVNNQTKNTPIPILTLEHYPLFIKKIIVCCDIQTTNVLTFTLWSDSTKTDKIFEFDSVSSSAYEKEIYELDISDLLINTVIEHDSDPLYLEFGSSGNCGLTSGKIYFELIQAT